MNDTSFRMETDLLGSLPVPATALHGIHTQRAVENFKISQRPISRHLVHAYGQVKWACARTNHELGAWDAATYGAIESACRELACGLLDDHVIVDALQGGAGTSTNMNVNEVIANRALQLLGKSPGEYSCIDPLGDVNLHQSTNDTFPTALRIAAIEQLRGLQHDVTVLTEAFQSKEHEFAGIVKVARTQLQDAVLTTLGRSMGAYAEAFARDRWRIYRCEERLRMVNLGGTAIGTGIGAPREYIFRAVDHLRQITGIGLGRSENLIDATQNMDLLVEVSGIVRSLASSLLKVSSDLRLLASGPDAGWGEIQLPARQAGSSIMPGKVNPVIPEAVAQAALAIAGLDQTLMNACSLGNLELNQYLPLIADCLLSSLALARNACEVFAQRCVSGIEASRERCAAYVSGATATVTALVDSIGYEAAQQVASTAAAEQKSIEQVVLERGLLSSEQYARAISPDAVMRLGSPPSQTPKGPRA